MIEGNVLEVISIILGLVFIWSTLIVTVGLLIPRRKHPVADRRLHFAVLICARNEESVIRLPVKSVFMSPYPKDRYEVIVLADNCTDKTAEVARTAGATVWEKTVPSSGKGDVLAWGVDKVLERGDFDAIAVFDADNIASAQWLDAMNDALNDGEVIATGRRMTSNATTNIILLSSFSSSSTSLYVYVAALPAKYPTAISVISPIKSLLSWLLSSCISLSSCLKRGCLLKIGTASSLVLYLLYKSSVYCALFLWRSMILFTIPSVMPVSLIVAMYPL